MKRIYAMLLVIAVTLLYCGVLSVSADEPAIGTDGNQTVTNGQDADDATDGTPDDTNTDSMPNIGDDDNAADMPEIGDGDNTVDTPDLDENPDLGDIPGADDAPNGDDVPDDETADGTPGQDESTLPTDDLESYTKRIASMVGEDAADAQFRFSMKAETTSDGVVTVVITLADIADGANLQNIYGQLTYDTEKLTLLTDIDETTNNLDCLTVAPSDGWENMSCAARNDEYQVIPGTLDIGALTSVDNTTVTSETPLIFTLRFRLNEGHTYGGLYIPTETVTGSNSALENVTGNGAYAVAVMENNGNSSDNTSDNVQTGDTGILVFALLGGLAAAGALVMTKARF